MSYKVYVRWQDGTTTHTEYADYKRVKAHADYRMDDADCVAVRIVNELTGKLRFERAKNAQGLRWLHEVSQ